MTDKFRGKVKALVFDLDGTLIDSKRDLVQSVNATLREIGRAELPEDLVASYVGSGAPVLIRRALGGMASAEEQESALKFFWRTTRSISWTTQKNIRACARRWNSCAACRWRC